MSENLTKESENNQINWEKIVEKNNESAENNSLESLIENAEKIEAEKKYTISTNISSLDDIIKINLINEYDYVTLVPESDKIKINFIKDNKIVEENFTTFPIYSNILIKVKQITNLKWDNNISQEWSGDYIYDNKNINIKTKTNPSQLWEQIYIKTELKTNKIQKTTSWQVLAFIWAIAFIWLILWWAFIVFVVMNAKTVEDVMFFNSLWISLNDVNAFIAKLVTIIFSLVLFVEVILFSIFWIKFLLTKKEFKKRRIILGILSTFLLLITFITASLWLVTVKKVNALPNWQEMSYWDIQVYDNTKLITEKFWKAESLIKQEDFWNLIWPITIKFDLTYYAQKEAQKWFKVEKFIWNFWNWESVEEITPIIIKEFKEKWTYNIKVSVQEKQVDWKTIIKEVENIPSISLKSVVKIKEDSTKSWWKRVTFDASDLRNLWKIEWYMEDDLEKPKLVWEIFTPWKIIFSDTLVWLYIRKEWKTDKKIDKIFLIRWDEETKITWEINIKKEWSDLEYEFSVKDPQISLDSWFIEEFRWKIWDYQKVVKAEVWNEEESSKIKYTFTSYWKKEITVTIVDSYWKTKELTKEIEVNKEIKLKTPLKIYNESNLISPRYENNDYFIQDLEIPTTLKFDARLVKLDNPTYSLQEVNWDTNWDWTNDKFWKTLDHTINYEWKSTIAVEYIFKNIKDSENSKVIKEYIYIDSIKKEAILDLEIIPSDNWYIPITVKFDASKSEVKWENIVKFIYDYWDGTPPEERDAVNQWHKYIEAWNYTIKLTVITENWKEYSMTKKLILKPRPQTAKITTSLKVAPTYQWIDFSSADSEWQITSYFWDFWDWETSTDANPTHAYKNPWEYTVTLKLDFANRNTLEDKISITIK